MATDAGGIKFTIENIIKTTGTQQVDQASKSMEQLGQQAQAASGLVDHLGNAIKSTSTKTTAAVSSTQQAAQATQQLAGTAKQAGDAWRTLASGVIVHDDALKKTNSTAGKTRSLFDQMTSGIQKNAKSTKDLTRELEQGDAVLEGYKRLLKDAKDKIALLTQANKDYEKALRETEKGMKAMIADTNKQIAADKKRDESIRKETQSILAQAAAEEKARGRIANAIARQENNMAKLRTSIMQNIQGEKSQEVALLRVERAFAVYSGRLQQSAGDSNKMSAALINLQKHLMGVQGSVRNSERGLSGLQKKFTDLSKSVQVALGPLSGVASRITAIASLANRNTIAIAGIVGITIAFGAAMSKAVKAGIEYESQMKVLENRVKILGGSIGFTADELDKMAIKLGKDTLTNAHEAREAIVILSTATTLAGDQFKRALTLAQDLSAQGLGGLTQNARILARAFADPGEGLEAFARKGVVFSDQLRDQIKILQAFGKTNEAVELILQRVEEAAKGAGKAAADSLKGAFDTLLENTTRLGEVLSTTSGVMDGLKEAVNELARDIDKATTAIERNEEVVGVLGTSIQALTSFMSLLISNVDAVILILGGAFAGKAVGFAIIQIARLVKALFAARAAFLAAQGIMAGFAAAAIPLAGIAGIIGAIVGATALLAIRTTNVNQKYDDMQEAIDEVNAKLEEQLALTEGISDAQRKQTRGTLTGLLEVAKAREASIKAELMSLQNLRREQERLAEMGKPEPQPRANVSFGPEDTGAIAAVGEMGSGLATTNKRIKELGPQLTGAKAQVDSLVESIEKLDKSGENSGDALKALADQLQKLWDEASKDLKVASEVADDLNDRLTDLAQRGMSDVQKETMEFNSELKAGQDAIAALSNKLAQYDNLIKNGLVEHDMLNEIEEERAKILEQLKVLLPAVAAAEANYGKIIDQLNEGREKALADAKIDIALKRQELMAAKQGKDALEKFRLEQDAYNETLKKYQELKDAGVDDFTAIQLAKDWSDANRALKEYLIEQDKVDENLKKIKDTAERFGNTFTSAFEDAVVEGEALSDVLQGLEQDLIRLIFRMLVLEPIQQGLAEGWENILKGQTEVEGGMTGDLTKDPLSEQGIGGLFNRAITGIGSFFGDDEKDKTEPDLVKKGGAQTAVDELLESLKGGGTGDIGKSLEDMKAATESVTKASSDLTNSLIGTGMASGDATGKLIEGALQTGVATTATSTEASTKTGLIGVLELFRNSIADATIAVQQFKLSLSSGGGGKEDSAISGIGSLLSVASMFSGGTPSRGYADTSQIASAKAFSARTGVPMQTGPRAFGGPVSPGRGYLVGEAGPELFFPNIGGNISSNKESMGGARVVQNIVFNVPPGNTANLNEDQLSNTIMRRGESALRRGLS